MVYMYEITNIHLNPFMNTFMKVCLKFQRSNLWFKIIIHI